MDVREKVTNGKRLIDADKLLTNVIAISNSEGQVTWSAVSTIDILAAPTVDAVEVIRCRECYHKTHDGSGRPYCLQLKMYLNKELDFFCKYGKRKEGAD